MNTRLNDSTVGLRPLTDDDWIITDDDMEMLGLNSSEPSQFKLTDSDWEYLCTTEDEDDHEVADGDVEDSIADSDDAFQLPIETESDDEMDDVSGDLEIRFDGGMGVGVIWSRNTFEMSVLYDHFEAAWYVDEDGERSVINAPLDLTSPKWDLFTLGFDVIEHHGVKLAFPVVESPFPWEDFTVVTRPLGALLQKVYPAIFDADSTRFEVIEDLVRLSRDIEAFMHSNAHAVYEFGVEHANVPLNFCKAVGCALTAIDVKFYFINRTKAARPYGLPAMGKDFDKSVQYKTLSSDRLSVAKCRSCNERTWVVKNEKYEVKLTNGKIKQESRKVTTCENPKCNKCKDFIGNCMFCRMPYTREVKDGWRADICTTFNCEQRFPRCVEHKRNKVYNDGDWECVSCLKAEAALKRQQVEEEKKSEDPLPDNFMNTFDEKTAEEPSPKPPAVDSKEEFPPLPSPEPAAPAVETEERVKTEPTIETPSTETIRMEALAEVKKAREEAFRSLNDLRVRAGKRPMSWGHWLRKNVPKEPPVAPPPPPPPGAPVSKRPLAEERRKLKKVEKRPIPANIAIDPCTYDHVTWHWTFDWWSAFIIALISSIYLPLFVLGWSTGWLDNFVTPLVMTGLCYLFTGKIVSTPLPWFPYLISRVWYSLFSISAPARTMFCLPYPIGEWYYRNLGTGCVDFSYDSFYLMFAYMLILVLLFSTRMFVRSKLKTKVVLYKRFEYLRPYHGTVGVDARVDAVAIGDYKHEADYGVWKVHTPIKLAKPAYGKSSRPQVLTYVESEEFIVSHELLRQLISIDKLHHATKDAVACEILLRAASRTTTVNIDKSIALETGQSVASNTVNVALAWLIQLKQNDPICLLNRLSAQPERESS